MKSLILIILSLGIGLASVALGNSIQVQDLVLYPDSATANAICVSYNHEKAIGYRLNFIVSKFDL